MFGDLRAFCSSIDNFRPRDVPSTADEDAISGN
jgi:hypothetical protein